MTVEAVLFASVATVLLIVTGLACYRQGVRDAISDIDSVAELGASVLAHLSDEPVRATVLVRVTKNAEDTFRSEVVHADPTAISEPAASA